MQKSLPSGEGRTIQFSAHCRKHIGRAAPQKSTNG